MQHWSENFSYNCIFRWWEEPPLECGHRACCLVWRPSLHRRCCCGPDLQDEDHRQERHQEGPQPVVRDGLRGRGGKLLPLNFYSVPQDPHNQAGSAREEAENKEDPLRPKSVDNQYDYMENWKPHWPHFYLVSFKMRPHSKQFLRVYKNVRFGQNCEIWRIL